jgi:hypothetical protein
MAPRLEAAAVNESLLNRMAVMTGLALAAATAVWWLGSTRLGLDHGTDGARFAADALDALLLVRGMALAVLSLRVAALRGWRPAFATGLGLIGPSWPVVLLAWSASTAPFSSVVLGEALLLAGSVALPLIGVGLRRWLRQAELAAITGTALGVALAAAVWLNHSLWVRALS